ncbi:MAG: hypothetical protein V1724_10165 [Chloroflexota bacterium]
MPRPRTDVHWRERVRALITDEPRMGDAKIAARLLVEAQEKGRDDSPSARTVRRMREEFKTEPAHAQAQYRAFYWPESMERGDIPWEASVHCMELLGYLFHSSRAEEYGRPTIRQAKWFWRVSTAVPDLHLAERESLARLLAIWQAVGELTKEATRSAEGFLAFAPWRSPENEQEYDKAIAEKVIPAMPETLGLDLVQSEKLYAASGEFGVAVSDFVVVMEKVTARFGVDGVKAAIEKFADAIHEVAARLEAEEQQNPVSREGTSG